MLAAAGGGSSADASDRKRGPSEVNGSSKRARVGGASSELSRREIAALVDAGERTEIAALDARAVKAMAKALQKRIRQNALLREKHADEPAKFMDSEVELDVELARWKPVAAAPMLYPQLVELGVAPMLLGLLAHENLDIRLSVISLLSELTDADEAEENSLAAAVDLAKHLVEQKLLPLLVSNLYQLSSTAKDDESEEEDEEAAGIYNSLQILENLADLTPHMSERVASDTPIFQFLMSQVVPKRRFSQNKLYASEILSIVLQSGPKPRDAFVKPQTLHVVDGDSTRHKDKKKSKAEVDLMDELLQAIAPYRKKDPSSDEEEEFVENLVNSLCSILLSPSAQQHFRRLEGLELMLRCLKDRKLFIFPAALRVLDHATMDNARNCERLVEVGGLKSIFSVFMGRKSAKASNNKKRDKAKEEENVVGIVTSMCAFVHVDAKYDVFDRLHAKFVESDMEKVDRLVDLFSKYLNRVANSTQVDDDDEEQDNEDRYLLRLDAGLFVLQRIAFVIAHLCEFSKKLQAYVVVKFHERNVELENLRLVLAEQLELLVADTAGEPADAEAKEDDLVRADVKELQKTQLHALLDHLSAAETCGPSGRDEQDKPEAEQSSIEDSSVKTKSEES